MTSVEINPVPGEPIELPKKKVPDFLDVVLPGLAVTSSSMLGLGLPGIIEGSGVASYAKVGVIAVAAGAVSYGINRLAIERGAPLAAKRFLGAALLSTVSILGVGAGLFAGTYPGLVLRDVEQLRLQEHGAALGEHVASRTAASAQGARAVPALRATVGDLQEKAECELKAGCISGSAGGYGTVARVMEELAGRAAAIEQQADAGLAARDILVGRLNGLMTEYQTTLADDGTGIWERRAELQIIDAKIRQELGGLDEAVPVAMMSAFAAELQAGVIVPGRPEVEARLNGILARHGQSLGAVIASAELGNASSPSFSTRTGVAHTFDYVGHFLPIAAVTAVVELAFPISLWAYTFWHLTWQRYTLLHAASHREDGAESRAVAGSKPGSRPDSAGTDRRAPRRSDHRNHLNGRRRDNGHDEDNSLARDDDR